MNEKIELPSGRTIRANNGIIGLTWRGDHMDSNTVFDGYDGTAYEPPPEGTDPEDFDLYSPPFTPEDRKAFARHMAERWLEWGGVR